MLIGDEFSIISSSEDYEDDHDILSSSRLFDLFLLHVLDTDDSSLLFLYVLMCMLSTFKKLGTIACNMNNLKSYSFTHLSRC